VSFSFEKIQVRLCLLDFSDGWDSDGTGGGGLNTSSTISSKDKIESGS
jgi:hypothetical protein